VRQGKTASPVAGLPETIQTSVLLASEHTEELQDVRGADIIGIHNA
jgi:hypothetical protein